MAEKLFVCIPVFNDWRAVSELLRQLDDVAGTLTDEICVLLVDDGSTESAFESLAHTPRHLRSVELLPLRRNLGHQRAIALGLTFVYTHRPCRAVVVMDADGEDAPSDVPALLRELDRHGGTQAVFAARSRRSEGLTFRVGYACFKLAHLALTGRKVEVGNFSAVPWKLIERLVAVSEIWNHYAAAIYKARFPVQHVPLPRAPRLAGESKMSFVSLVTHGLSAISVYGETVGVRMLCLAGVLMLATFAGIAGVVAVRFLTELAIPGWATNAVGVLTVLMANLSLILTIAVLIVLQSRDRYSFLPLRDYPHYLLPTRSLHG